MSFYGHNSGELPHIFRTCTASESHTRIRNAVIDDPILSDADLGTLVRLLKLPAGWHINPEELASRSRKSARTEQRKLRRLEKAGYYWLEQENDGVFGDTRRFVADDPKIKKIYLESTSRQKCRAETERQICLAVKELAESRGNKLTGRTTKMSSGPHDKLPRAEKCRHIKKRTKDKEIKDSLNGSPCAFDEDEINSAVQAWNDLATRAGLPKISELTANRKKHLTARLKEDGLKSWLEVLSRIERSAFLCGDNDRGWRVDFNWLVKPSNFIKVLEGNYGNGRIRTASAASDFDDEHWRRALQTFKQFGDWNTSQYGNKPGFPGCRVPEHLLKEMGL